MMVIYCGDNGGKNKKGLPCGQEAGWGTPHPGDGKCKLHGGCSTGAPITTGKYARVTHRRLADKIEKHLNDPRRGTLDREQAELRALLDYIHERIIEAEVKRDELQDKYTGKELSAIPDPIESYLEILVNLIDRIVKVVDTMSKIQSRELLTIAEMMMFRVVYADVLREEVTDSDTLARIFAKLRSRLQIPELNRREDLLTD